MLDVLERHVSEQNVHLRAAGLMAEQQMQRNDTAFERELDREQIDYVAMTEWNLIAHCGDNGERWAAAFMAKVMGCRPVATTIGVALDEGLMICWFANAIEAAWSKRAREGRSGATPGAIYLNDVAAAAKGQPSASSPATAP